MSSENSNDQYISESSPNDAESKNLILPDERSNHEDDLRLNDCLTTDQEIVLIDSYSDELIKYYLHKSNDFLHDFLKPLTDLIEDSENMLDEIDELVYLLSNCYIDKEEDEETTESDSNKPTEHNLENPDESEEYILPSKCIINETVDIETNEIILTVEELEPPFFCMDNCRFHVALFDESVLENELYSNEDLSSTIQLLENNISVESKEASQQSELWSEKQKTKKKIRTKRYTRTNYARRLRRRTSSKIHNSDLSFRSQIQIAKELSMLQTQIESDPEDDNTNEINHTNSKPSPQRDSKEMVAKDIKRMKRCTRSNSKLQTLRK